MTRGEVDSLLAALAGGADMVSGKRSVKVARDPGDHKFLAAALEGKADHFVTGHRDLLDLDVYRGVRIVTPAAFLAILRG